MSKKIEKAIQHWTPQKAVLSDLLVSLPADFVVKDAAFAISEINNILMPKGWVVKYQGIQFQDGETRQTEDCLKFSVQPTDEEMSKIYDTNKEDNKEQN